MNILYLKIHSQNATPILHYLKKYLPTAQVIEVNTQADFEEKLANLDVDLILYEDILPHYGILTALPYVKKIKPDAPLIFISEPLEENHTIRLFDAGVTDFISKTHLSRLKPSIIRALNDVNEKNQRKQIEQMLTTRNFELGQIVHILSHDLKAPLIAIERLSTWIEEDSNERLSDESKLHLQLMRQRVSRLFRLIEGIFQYSQASQMKPNPQLVDTKVIIEKVIADLNPPQGFSIQYDENLPCVMATEGVLNLVFFHLIGNSIKHHHHQTGHIEITSTDSGDDYTFCVSDDGPGIQPEYYDKIFQIFQTLQARDVYETTGIGLTLVKKIVESHGGTMNILSKREQGITFCFTWPKVPKNNNHFPYRR